MHATILLYYKYVEIADPKALMDAQRQLCSELGLKGRIIIAHEGINGTVEGTTEATDRYIAALTADSRFADIHIKKSEGTGSAFPKLSIRVRHEIVSTHLGEHDVNPVTTTGKYLTAAELHEWLRSDREFYIVDMRNDYEHAVGHFDGSLLPAMHHFRELPDIIDGITHLKGKTVVTVCTGGVRCEKASGYLLENGFADVYQLHGGIVTYMEAYPNQDFHGQLYVFDGRVTMGFNTEDSTHVTVGRCERCGIPCETFINCANNDCHRHFICCNDCRSVNQAGYCPRPDCMALAARATPVLA